ncbi:MAG: gamma-butyrobetaine hydroxylase-like domain-containing protein [Alphaproteobacteria bacterium]|tara:strand:- start:469 stop:774 length:306 start_codon:yes stop_codon:yes gene_type:complete
MTPKSITLNKNKKSIQIQYGNNSYLLLSSSFLRANSPSAENRSKDSLEKFKTAEDKHQDVLISKIEGVGNYAIRIVFDDGHNTGIFSYEYMYDIGTKAQNA